jgi:hypothetical protein
VLPFTVTAIFPVPAAKGTDVNNCVELADCTIAACPLNVTWLLAAVVLKPVPVMITVVVYGPEVALKEVTASVDPVLLEPGFELLFEQAENKIVINKINNTDDKVRFINNVISLPKDTDWHLNIDV